MKRSVENVDALNRMRERYEVELGRCRRKAREDANMADVYQEAIKRLVAYIRNIDVDLGALADG